MKSRESLFHGRLLPPSSLRKNKYLGFSLIEFMIVVAVIGVLVSIVIPQYRTFRLKSHQGEAKTVLSSLYLGQHLFYKEHNTYCMSWHIMFGDDPPVQGNMNYEVFHWLTTSPNPRNTLHSGCGYNGLHNSYSYICDIQWSGKCYSNVLDAWYIYMSIIHIPYIVTDIAATKGTSSFVNIAYSSKKTIGEHDVWSMDQDKNLVHLRGP